MVKSGRFAARSRTHAVAQVSLLRLGLPCRFRSKRLGLALETHHVVDKLDRHPQLMRRCGEGVPVLHQRHGAPAKGHGMRFTHSDPIHLPQGQGITTVAPRKS